MAKSKIKKTKTQALDSVYLFKLAFYLLVGAQWLRLSRHGHTAPLPVGLLVGLAFSTHERLRIDRKIEYALLLVAALVGYWSLSGISLSI